MNSSKCAVCGLDSMIDGVCEICGCTEDWGKPEEDKDNVK